MRPLWQPSCLAFDVRLFYIAIDDRGEPRAPSRAYLRTFPLDINDMSSALRGSQAAMGCCGRSIAGHAT